MMRDLSNHFCIIAPELLSDYLTPGECRYMPHGAIDIGCSRKIVLDQSPLSDSDGNRWSISMSASTREDKVQLYDGKRAYIGIMMTDGTMRILGNSHFIPKISVTPYANAYAISVSYEALKAIEY